MVSIIMGVYNGERTLPEALESMIAQTYKDWELIACDDCSKDHTYRILVEYSKKDPRIKVIQNQKNSGLAASLNHCLEYATGKYIARMDCDDISVPDRLEKQVRFLEEHPVYQLVGTNMQAFNEKGKGDVIFFKEEPTKYDLPKANPFAHATVMMYTSVLKSLNGYRIAKYTARTEDVDLWYRFFASGYKGTTIQEPLYLVRMDAAAYKRRALKYMLHASYIIWYGCDMVKLPFYYKIYSIKPILSWLLPKDLKVSLRKIIIQG